jgi:hypothetical protein
MFTIPVLWMTSPRSHFMQWCFFLDNFTHTLSLCHIPPSHMKIVYGWSLVWLVVTTATMGVPSSLAFSSPPSSWWKPLWRTNRHHLKSALTAVELLIHDTPPNGRQVTADWVADQIVTYNWQLRAVALVYPEIRPRLADVLRVGGTHVRQTQGWLTRRFRTWLDEEEEEERTTCSTISPNHPFRLTCMLH